MSNNFRNVSLRKKQSLLIIGLLLLALIIAIATVFIGRYVILLITLFFIGYFIIRSPLLFLKIYFILGPLIWTYSDSFYIPISALRINTPVIIGGLIVVFYFRFLFFPITVKIVKVIRNLVLLLLVFAFPAIFWSRSFIYGLGEYIRLISPYIIMFSIYHLIQDEDQAKSIINFMSFATISTLATLLIGYFQGDIFSTTGGFLRLSGGGINFQPFAKFIAINIQILIILITLKKRRSQTILFVQVLLSLIILFLTYHRTSWIIFILNTFFGLLLFSQKKIFWLIFCGLIISLILFYRQIFDLFIRYVPSFRFSELDLISSGRISIWRTYLSSYFNAHTLNIIFGMGFGDPKNVTIANLGKYYWPHNDYLAFLIETGITPLILYILILVILMSAAFRNINTKRFLFHSVISKHTVIITSVVLIAGIAGTFYNNIMSGWYIYAFFGIFLASITIFRQPDSLVK